MTKPKAKNKNFCSKCLEKHIPPTGKKCTRQVVEDSKLVKHSNKKSAIKTAPVLSFSDSDSVSGSSSEDEVTRQSDCSAKRALALGSQGPSDHAKKRSQDSSSEEEDHKTADTQVLILKQLKKVNSRLDAVEEKMATTSTNKRHKGLKLSKCCDTIDHVSKKSSQKSKVVSSSSSEEEDLPCLSTLRSSRQIQRKIDRRISEMQLDSKIEGRDIDLKNKSKRGGNVDVLVKRRVAWPQDAILGGVTKQRISYDQLSLTQFVQGFTKNILEESDEKIRQKMLSYMADLMEDASDFCWANAKASHAVLLCEMERGTVWWTDTE